MHYNVFQRAVASLVHHFYDSLTQVPFRFQDMT